MKETLMPTAKPNNKNTLKAKRLEALEELIVLINDDMIEDFVIVGMDKNRNEYLWIGCEDCFICLSMLEIGKDILKVHISEKKENKNEQI